MRSHSIPGPCLGAGAGACAGPGPGPVPVNVCQQSFESESFPNIIIVSLSFHQNMIKCMIWYNIMSDSDPSFSICTYTYFSLLVKYVQRREIKVLVYSR